MHGKSPSITTDPHNRTKLSKLIDYVIIIKFTRAFLMSRFPNFLRNTMTHFHMFSYLVTCFPRVTVSLHASYKIRVLIYPDLK